MHFDKGAVCHRGAGKPGEGKGLGPERGSLRAARSEVPSRWWAAAGAALGPASRRPEVGGKARRGVMAWNPAAAGDSPTWRPAGVSPAGPPALPSQIPKDRRRGAAGLGASPPAALPAS